MIELAIGRILDHEQPDATLHETKSGEVAMWSLSTGSSGDVVTELVFEQATRFRGHPTTG